MLDLKDLLADDNRYLRDELRRVSREDVIGADFGLKEVMEMARQVAPMASPVLLLGETGAGKEVIANAIHNLSFQKDGSGPGASFCAKEGKGDGAFRHSGHRSRRH
ncbi:MAG: sigma 54-interacting transcriptional regulator [Pseudomonadota bacterium]